MFNAHDPADVTMRRRVIKEYDEQVEYHVKGRALLECRKD